MKVAVACENGFMMVEAETKEEAMEIFRDDSDFAPLPEDDFSGIELRSEIA